MKIHRLVVLVAFAAVLFALVRPVAAQELQPASGAGENTEVVAQGIAPFAGGAMAWRLVEDTADPSGARALLDEGEAAFTDEGAVQLRESLSDTATPYLRIGLVDASEARN